MRQHVDKTQLYKDGFIVIKRERQVFAEIASKNAASLWKWIVHVLLENVGNEQI